MIRLVNAMESNKRPPEAEIRFIVIGASLGGLHALQTLFRGLPANYCLPIAVVLHRGKESSNERLVNLLQQSSSIPVIEVEDKTPIVPGVIHVAPAGYHLLVETGHFALSTEAPVLYARPAIDLLFETASTVFRDKLVGILLTGASTDGAKGLLEIKRYGGFTLVQDPGTAEADTMPLAAIRKNAAHRIVSLEAISNFLAVLPGEQGQTHPMNER